MRGNVFAGLLVLVGVFFLLTNLGLLRLDIAELVRVWWPVGLIALGVALFFTPPDSRK